MNVCISHDNVWCYVDTTSNSIHELLGKTLRYRPSGYNHVYSFKSGKWDGYNVIYNFEDKVFRRGLLNRVVNVLQDAGHTVIAKYTGAETPTVNHKFDSSAMRPYTFQEDIVTATINNKIGLVVSPTGSGKTVSICKMISKINKKTLVLVTDIVLLDQMQQSIQGCYNQQIGMIGDGEFDVQDITVSTVQSIISALKAKTVKAAKNRKVLLDYFNEVGLVISDEAHQSDSNTFATIMPYFVNTDRVIGLSATPYAWNDTEEHEFNLELEQHFGTVIKDCRSVDMMALKLKVPLHVNVINNIPVNLDYKEHRKAGRYGKSEPDFSKNYRSCLETELLKNPEYHSMIASLAWGNMSTGKSVFVHAPHSIQFGVDIQSQIPGSVLVNGTTPRLERRAVYDAMRKKELLVVVSDVGGTGLNIPSLDSMILAGDCKDVRQLYGRVTRTYNNKSHGTIIDIKTETAFLGKHYKIRKSQYKNDNAIFE